MECLQRMKSVYFVSVLISVLALVKCSFSLLYVVGNEAGWTLPSVGHVNYTDWASTHTFYVGDSLLFNSTSPAHNVFIVDAADYNFCVIRSPIQTFNGEQTVIDLSNSGDYYFICGSPGHCDQGQKLKIRVYPRMGGDLVPNSAPTPANSAPTPANSPEMTSKAKSYKFMGFFRSATKILAAVILAACIPFMI